MYDTSNDLLQHFKTEHGVRCWVCDHCSMQTSDFTSFIFETLDEWVTHMNNLHHDTFADIQSVALSELCTRVMVPPVSCPLCGYSTFNPSAILDEHIAQHLHTFALSSLPWGPKQNEQEDDRLSDQAGEPQSTSKIDISMLSHEKGSTVSQNLPDARDNFLSHMEEEPQSLTKNKISLLSHEKSNIVLRNWLDTHDNLSSRPREDIQSTTQTDMSLLSPEGRNAISFFHKIHLGRSELS